MRQIGRLKLSLAFFACVLGSALAAGPPLRPRPKTHRQRTSPTSPGVESRFGS